MIPLRRAFNRQPIPRFPGFLIKYGFGSGLSELGLDYDLIENLKLEKPTVMIPWKQGSLSKQTSNQRTILSRFRQTKGGFWKRAAHRSCSLTPFY